MTITRKNDDANLVDEVMMLLLDYARALSAGAAKHDHEARLEERISKLLITRIAKGPLPDEVGRSGVLASKVVTRRGKPRERWIRVEDAGGFMLGDILIALSPEEEG